MKLILTSNVANLGKAGDVVEVKNGYGRNYLLPQKLAILATPGAEKQIADITKVKAIQANKILEQANTVKSQLENLTDIVVPVRITTNGKLFGSVKPIDIAAAVRAKGGPSVDSRKILLPDNHIKKTGKYRIEVCLHPEVIAKITISVRSEMNIKKTA